MEEVTKVKDLIEQKVPMAISGFRWQPYTDLRSCTTTPSRSSSIAPT